MFPNAFRPKESPRWYPLDTVVMTYNDIEIHRDKKGGYWWDRGGFFSTPENCMADIDRWFAETERLCHE